MHADGPGKVMLTCTFFIILITALFSGGGCATLIERLQLKAPSAGRRDRGWGGAPSPMTAAYRPPCSGSLRLSSTRRRLP